MTHKDRYRRRQQMAAQIRSGKSIAEVANLFGVCADTVRTSCYEFKPALPHRERYQRRKAMASLVADGYVVGDVAARFGVTSETVRNACQQHQTRIRPQPKLPAVSSFQILFHLTQSETQSSVARAFGVTHQRVEQIARQGAEAGFRIPSRRGNAPDSEGVAVA